MGLNSSAIGFCYVLVFLWICKSNAQIFNILQFGAIADGVTDNSQALSSAWGQACASNGNGVVLIPEGTFLVLPIMFSGPCNGSTQLQLDGVLLAPDGPSFVLGDNWLVFHRVSNLVVDGHGTLNGQGASAWSICGSGGSCPPRPATMRLNSINTATIRNINSVNSKNLHLTVYGSQTVTFDSVTVSAPADSPNTDGIHISLSTGVHVVNSAIGTGDDCISIGPGSKSINISNVNCGPGHGISIGSLGGVANESDVAGVTVTDSTFTNTSNGVRIKTWSSNFTSLVSDISFLHLEMNNVENPITIDQNYCPHDKCQKGAMSESRVQIQGVRYEDIRGSSSTEVAVNLYCSQVAPCQGIVLQSINMSFNGGGAATSICVNAQGAAFGPQLPPSCLP